MEVVWTVFFAFLFAEFAGGLFHWWEDRYGNPDWPIIGALIVLPNIEHHKRPGLLCQGTWWNRNNTTLVPCLFGAALALAGWYYLDWPLLWLVFGFLILGQMNEVHSWSHQRCNPVIRFFQSTGLLQSCHHHKIHHERPYNRNYCVFSNYLNPVLEHSRFWDLLERVVYLLCGAWPRPERAIY